MAYDVLIVDDETDIRTLVAEILEDEGFHTRTAANSTEALKALDVRRPNLLLLDIWLQDSQLDGMGILEAAKSQDANLPVIMMSGHGTVSTAVEAMKKGAYDFIEKPFAADVLVLSAQRAIETAQLRRENQELMRRAAPATHLDGISTVISHVRQAINKVAPTNSRVLITGAAGSGKEVAARMIHQGSKRAQGPFVVLNCALLEPERMEEELFGIESKEDGNSKAHTGTFEEAHLGTMFLDEVADMPMETQKKIVRVLQDQTFERVGGTSKVQVDVRVIASSSRDLSEEIENGRFRQDLFYRLSVVPIDIPSLAERKEDIPFLAERLMESASRAAGRPPRELKEDAVAALQSYNWPGNVRELRNIIERLLIMAPGAPQSPISAEVLPNEVIGNTPTAVGWEKNTEILGMPLREAREVFEREYLQAQLTRFGGNISRTAGFVEMERSALHRKIKTLGINGEERTRE